MEYVHVIVPLKLDWEPVYRVPEGMCAQRGDRVKVRLAGREYVGVVHDSVPDSDVPDSRIISITENCSKSQEQSLAAISQEELELWEFVSEYYMCTVGEVYKAAYPAARLKLEKTKSRRASETEASQLSHTRHQSDIDLCRKIFDVFADGRPALLAADSCKSRRIAGVLSRRIISEGRSVLVLSPGREDAPEGFLQYNSDTTPAARRDLAARLRSGAPCAVFGTRMSVFLPFTNLSLVIILDEHSISFKQSEPAPRYNGRDVAIMLASIHHADVLLCSEIPSMESIFNCEAGKYGLVTSSEDCIVFDDEEDFLIDTTIERRKNGMIGSLSRKLITRISIALEQKQRVALLLPWKDTDDLEIEARALFPQARTRLEVMSLNESHRRNLDKYSVVALLNADFLLKGEDFRSDEKALRQMAELNARAGGKAVIQTSDAAHPVFEAVRTTDRTAAIKAMMPLRSQFGLPPYTRIVDIIFKDSNEARRRKMIRELSLIIKDCQTSECRIRVILPKSRAVIKAKRAIFNTVLEFEKTHDYRGFIFFDADPL